jgi:hypothetical protein
MVLKYSDKPQLRYGGGNYVSRLETVKLPPGRQWRSMNSAPMGARPIVVATSSGTAVWAMHHRDSWRPVQVLKDEFTGAKRVQMTGDIVNALAWASS